MAKRGYKLQEFVAHSANVNCIKIGKKTRRHFITGGDDEKVNLWAIGKPSSITSLSGHTSPVESVAFDSTEVLVAAGASSGMIKLWDLEETKMVRTLNGHRSYCTAVEFHPFGEFLASGSMDTNLKIWDIRKKGCIHTYKGHKRAISTIRFTPDGRWVVSGGLDNIVKVWDLTAGKLLHEFKFHEGHIRSIDFHPLEFLLATGSSDRTVKFWDLETFELIGSTRPEATSVRAITFHPDGRTLFCGLDSSLKVYSWEPVICHDAVDMGWSTLGDLCIDDGKLLGCSYYQNSVGVWVADVSQVEPYGPNFVPVENVRLNSKMDLKERSLERAGSPRRSSISLEDDMKDIKNIYVDTVTPVASKKAESSPNLVTLPEPEDGNDLAANKQFSAAKGVVQGNSFVVPSNVLHDNSEAKEVAKFRRESIASGHGVTNVSLKPPHKRRPSSTKLDIEVSNITAEPLPKIIVDNHRRFSVDDEAKDTSEEKMHSNRSIVKEFQKPSSPRTLPNKGNGDGSVDSKQGDLKPVKYVNGVAVVHGRTRSLVEKFEKRENLNTDECQPPDLTARLLPKTGKTPLIMVEEPGTTVPCVVPVATTSPTLVKTPEQVLCAAPEPKTSSMLVRTPDVVPCAVVDVKRPHSPVTTPDEVPTPEAKVPPIPVKKPVVVSSAMPEAKTSRTPVETPDMGVNMISEVATSSPVLVVQRPKTAPNILSEKAKASPMQRSATTRRMVPERVRSSPLMVARRSSVSSQMRPERTKTSPLAVPRHNISTPPMPEKAKSSPLLDESPQTTGRGLMPNNNDDDVEDLMLNHDLFLSTLRSRLTKLQVLRHFWERNDMKGAINALRKLPDHAVQADLVSVLMEKMEIVTLDLFSFLLPVLLGLLDSNVERHVNVSLEMLLKLVAVFGPVVSATISAPPAVGVDLHAEKRLECCNQCHVQLQKIHNCLPTIIRRGGLPARCAQELNLILQQT